MGNIRQLDGYKEAEVVAARVAASKMGFFEKAPGENAGYGGEARTSGGKYMDAEPGVMEELPAGMKFVQYDPSHPTTAFGEFLKDNKRGQAAAFGVAYMSYAQDPGDANFSSARIGLLDEREGFKMLQERIVDHVLVDIFEDWLFTALTFQTIGTLPAGKFDKFNGPNFVPHRWDWLDPRSDTEARAVAEDRGWISPAQIIAERGGDEEEVNAEIATTLDERLRLGLVRPERAAAIQTGRAFLASQAASAEPPLASKLGVGGTQALTTFIQQIALPENVMTEEAILTMLTEVFGMSAEAARKVAKRKPAPPVAQSAPPANVTA